MRRPGSTSQRAGTPGYLEPAEAETLMGQAVNVSEGKLVEDTVDDTPRPSNMRRVVVREVEVPFTRKVKVPIKQTVIEPITVTKRVKVKRLVEVPSTKEVEEEYTEIAHRKKIVKKEVWVKQIVEEEVDEPYEVKKTRMITVPTTKLEEVEEWQTVEVQEDRKVEKDSFRIDEVEDTKLVEVQEEQVFELVPRAVETHVIGAAYVGGECALAGIALLRYFIAADMCGSMRSLTCTVTWVCTTRATAHGSWVSTCTRRRRWRPSSLMRPRTTRRCGRTRRRASRRWVSWCTRATTGRRACW